MCDVNERFIPCYDNDVFSQFDLWFSFRCLLF